MFEHLKDMYDAISQTNHCPKHGPYEIECMGCLRDGDAYLEAQDMLKEMHKGEEE